VKLNIPISMQDLEVKNTTLSTRACNALESAGVRVLRDLDGMTPEEIALRRNIGPRVLSEIIGFIARLPERDAPQADSTRISVPANWQDADIGVLALSHRAHNALGFNRITKLAQLHGLNTDLTDFRNVGPVVANEIVGALSRLPSDPKQLRSARPSADLGGGRSGDPAADEPFTVPPELFHIPVSLLELSSPAAKLLSDLRVHVFGDLRRLTMKTIAENSVTGAETVQAIVTGMEALTRHPLLTNSVAQSEGVSRAVRALRAKLLHSLLGASGPDAEIEALLREVSSRNAELIRARWTRVQGRRLQLETIGQEHDLTRERVRQIVTTSRNVCVRAVSDCRCARALSASLPKQAGRCLTGNSYLSFGRTSWT
jgi:hypothetical protein